MKIKIIISTFAFLLWGTIGAQTLQNIDRADRIVQDSIENDKEIITWLFNEANSLMLEAKYNQAKSYFQKALNLAHFYGDEHGSHEVELGLAQLEYEIANYDNCISLTNSVLKNKCNKCTPYIKGKFNELLYKTYSKTNQPILALNYFEKFKEYEFKQYEEEKAFQMTEFEAYFNTQTKEKENLFLKTKQQENLATIRNASIASIFFFLFVLLLISIAIISYNSNIEKKKYNKKLEEQVALRTQELSLSNSELIISNEELERFAYIASHDLKEPLRNISGFSKLLERRLVIGDHKDISEYLNFLQINANQMHNLIEDVLQYSTITNKALDQKVEIVDLNDILLIAKTELHELLEKRKARVVYEDLPLVRVTKSNFITVFKNLIENAIKYNHADHPEVYIHSSQSEDMFHLHFSDNGIGIDSEYFSRIFEMFKRLHNREEYEGSGLGLSICKKIVSHHKGSISVESRAERGSRFTVLLPLDIVMEAQSSEAENISI